MPGGIGALGGLGNALTGYNQEYDQSIKQLGDVAFGKTLQMFNSGQQQQQPQPPQMPQPQGWTPPQGQQAMPGGGPQTPQVMPPPAPMQGMPPQGMPQGQPGMPPQMPQGGGGMPPPMQRPPMPQGGGQMPPQQQQPMGGQMPPGMPQGGQQPPQLNWQTIFQKVRQANPGATPQVLAAAVDRFMPLMNQQSQQQWEQSKADAGTIVQRYPELRGCLADQVIFLDGGYKTVPMSELTMPVTLAQADAVVTRLR